MGNSITFNTSMERANVRFGTTILAGCINPSALAVNNITTNSAILSWNGFAANSPAGFDWEVRVGGDGGSGSNGLVTIGSTTGTTSTATATGLTAAVNYKLYVRAKCNGGNTSSWTGPYNFTTACNMEALPFVQGFNSNIRPSCWRQDFIAGVLPVDFTFSATGTKPTANAFEGTNMILFSSNTIESGTKMRLVSPAIASTGVASIDVDFEWFHSEELPNYPDKLTVQYSLDGTSWTDVPDGTILRFSDTAGWSHKNITLPAAASNQPSIYVGFLFISGYGYNCYVDDIQIKASAISCRAPLNISTSAITSETATIYWEAPLIPPANGYEWKIVNATAGPGGTAIQSGFTNNTSVVVTGLPSSSNLYSVYVRSICDGANSIWGNVVTFSTLCAVFPLPFKEDFANYTASFPPPCWTSNNAAFIKGCDRSAFSQGHGSLLFNNFLANHGDYEVILPVTMPVTDGYQLIFNYAYAPYSLGSYADGLAISYSTDGGNNYRSLATYTSETLATAAGKPTAFEPNANHWGIKYISLPAGTNRIKFVALCKGGNNLFIDNVEIKVTESKISISPNPANNYIIVRGTDMTNATMIIRDMLGRTVLSAKGKAVVDIPRLPSGEYIATIYMASGKFTHKLVVIK